MKQLTVELPGREYDILIGTGLFGAVRRAYPRRDAGGTAGGSDRQQCGTAVFENGDGKFAEGWIYCFSVTFPAGEASKNIRTLNNLL